MKLKIGLVSKEDEFIKEISKNFLEYYKPLILYI